MSPSIAHYLFCGLQLPLACLPHVSSRFTKAAYIALCVITGLEIGDSVLRKFRIEPENRFYQEREDAQLDLEQIILPMMHASCVSAVYFFFFYRRTESSMVNTLKDVVSKADLSNIKITMAPPISYKIMMWFLTNKIIFDALRASEEFDAPRASEEKNPLRYLIAAGFRGLSLYSLSRLEWLTFERKILNPLKGKPFSIGSSVKEAFRGGLKSVTLRLQFIAPAGSPLIADTKGLKAIYDYTSAFFENSHWNCYLRIVGKEENLNLSAKIFDRSITLAKKNFSSHLYSWSGLAYAELYFNRTPFYRFGASLWKGHGAVQLSFK